MYSLFCILNLRGIMHTSLNLSSDANFYQPSVGGDALKKAALSGVKGAYPSISDEEQFSTYLSKVKTVVPIVKNIPTNLTSDHGSLSQKDVNELGTIISKQIKIDHFEIFEECSDIKIDETKEVQCVDCKIHKNDLAFVKFGPKVDIKEGKNLLDDEIKTLIDKGYRPLPLNKDNHVRIPAGLGIEQSEEFVLNGHTFIFDLMSKKEEEEFENLINDFFVSIQNLKTPEKKDDDSDKDKVIISKQKGNVLFASVNNIVSNDFYIKNIKHDVKVLSESIIRLREAKLQLERQEYAAYIECANRADDLKRLILKKSREKEGIKIADIDYAEAQKIQINSSVDTQTLHFEQHKVIHFSTLTFSDFNSKPGLMKAV